MNRKVAVLLLIVLVVALFGVLFSLQNPSVNLLPDENKSDSADQVIAQVPEKVVPLVYHNAEVGLSFNYMGIEEKRTHNPIQPGDKGRMFVDGVNLGGGRMLSVMSQTNDFLIPRGGQLSDATGYKKENGEFFILFNRSNTKVNNAEIVSVDGGHAEMLIVRDTDIQVGEGSYPIHQIAIINNPNKIFPVLVFESLPRPSIPNLKDPPPPTEVLLLSDEEFLKIISTVRFDNN